jgi:Major tropism determinant N-terminal domain
MACPPGHIQIRRDTSSNWNTINPYLLPGEFAYATDTGVLKIGPGYWSSAQIIGGGSAGGTGPTGPTGDVGPTGPAGPLLPNFIAVGCGNAPSTDTIYVSEDGLSWSNTSVVAQPTFSFGNAVAWNGEYWLAFGQDNNSLGNTIYKSTDGLTWSPAGDNTITNSIIDGIWYYNSSISSYYWIVVGDAGILGHGAVATSPDANTWTVSSVFSYVAYGIAWDGANTVVVVGDDITNGGNGRSLAYSTSGFSLTQVAPIVNGDSYYSFIGYGVAYNGSMWVAVGSDNAPLSSNTIFTSTDGQTWTNTGVTGQFSGESGISVAWNGTVWIAVGSLSILHSTDGLTWNTTSINVSSYNTYFQNGGFPKILWTGQYWLVAGSPMLVSYDNGNNWAFTEGSQFEYVGNGLGGKRIVGNTLKGGGGGPTGPQGPSFTGLVAV